LQKTAGPVAIATFAIIVNPALRAAADIRLHFLCSFQAPEFGKIKYCESSYLCHRPVVFCLLQFLRWFE